MRLIEVEKEEDTIAKGEGRKKRKRKGKWLKDDFERESRNKWH